MLDRILVIGGGSIGQLHYKIAKILLPNSECLHLQQREFIFLSGAKFIHGDQYTKAMAFKPLFLDQQQYAGDLLKNLLGLIGIMI